MNEIDFWKKFKRLAHSTGRELAEKALWLFYAAGRPETPTWARGVILSALGYFIMPLDAVPDFIPGAGYADDITVLATAVATVAMFINAEVREKTERTLARWSNKTDLTSASTSVPENWPTTTEMPDK